MGLTEPLATRARTRAVLVLLGLLAVAAAVDAGLWWRAARWNAQIEAATAGDDTAGAAGAQAAASAPAPSASGGAGEGGASGAGASQPAPGTGDDLPAELRFAQAWRRALLARQAASAHDREAALARYRPLQGDNPLGQAARYNSANLLLRQAMEVRATLQPGQAIPLLELAKEGYRDVLRHDPGFWAARYNLERAQRLLPDAEDEEPPVSEPAPEAERAATTMRGHSAGLP